LSPAAFALRVAVEADPIDLALDAADVTDALSVIRERIAGLQLITPPTVALALLCLSGFAEEDGVRAAAQAGLRSFASEWAATMGKVPV
jgi:hypothetical protein